MIRAFCGEYLMVPFPLHLMGAQCSHGCGYCFAQNPPRPGSTIDETLKQIARLSSKTEASSVINFLFRAGYDLCFSNTTDPFAESNREFTHEILSWAISNKRGIAFQTKGGSFAAEELSRIPPSFVYLTITSDDDEVLKLLEPGAPRFDDRLELAKVAGNMGHFVEVALNPYYSDFWKNPKKIFERIKEAGVDHIFMAPPHFSSGQKENLASGFKSQFADFVEFGAKKKQDNSKFLAMRNFLKNMGFNVMTRAVSSGRNYWDKYFQLGKKFFPTLDGFVSHLSNTYEDAPVAFSFDYFHKWANVFGDHKSSTFKEYVCGFGRTLRNKGMSDKAYNMEDVHKTLWDIFNVPSWMADDCLSYAGKFVDGKPVFEMFNESPVMVYQRGIRSAIAPIEKYNFVG